MINDESGSSLVFHWRLTKRASVDRRLTAGDIAVLIAILDRMNDAGVCWPSLNRVALDTGLSRATVVRCVKRLVESTYLERDSGTRVASNRYRAGALPRHTDEPRRIGEPEVGANTCAKVGAPVSLEPTTKNLPQETTQKPKRPRAALSSTMPLPEWILPEAWDGFVEARSQYPLTAHAAQLMLTALAKLRDAGHDPNACLDQSTRNGWRDVFPVRPDALANAQSRRKVGSRTAVERVAEANRIHDEREGRRW